MDWEKRSPCSLRVPEPRSCFMAVMRRGGQHTLEEIRTQTGNTRLHWYRADFSELSQVRALAERLAREQERIDVLLNNVGIGTTLPGGGARQESEDGYELRFAVNYLAPFLLTRLLLPSLRQSAPARIVNVSSAGQAPIDFGDVMLERRYDGVQAYCQSKLALIMFTFDLAEELPATAVTANCLHTATYMPTKMVLAARGIMYNLARFSQEENRNRAQSIHNESYLVILWIIDNIQRRQHH